MRIFIPKLMTDVPIQPYVGQNPLHGFTHFKIISEVLETKIGHRHSLSPSKKLAYWTYVVYTTLFQTKNIIVFDSQAVITQ